MKFRKMKELLFWLKLEKGGFYEEVSFESKEAEKNLTKFMEDWLFRLKKCKKIRIESFKDLFRELKEIEFPIKIKECYAWVNCYITIIDHKGTGYYMTLASTGYKALENYHIGKREEIIPEISFMDKNFNYKISKNGIILKEVKIWKSNKYEDNPSTEVKICFDSEEHTTEAILLNPYITIKDYMKIKYPTMDSEFDQKVQDYLFDVSEKYYYYCDVFSIFKWMISTLPMPNVSFSIVAEVDDEIYSEIDVVQGIVQRYTKTEIISEGERRTEIEVFAKKLEDFLAERK